ncbi:MAG TPA: sugar-binding protein, partial [Spirochaetota bacterium]|nr:sugar-binding protein [Spirochaetota bacterium]
GLQLDVEPFLTKEWKEMPDAPEKYIAMLKGVKKRMDSCGMDLANGHAIPVWYNNMQSNYMERVIDTLDYVALMDYFDSADRQVMNAREEIEYAEKTGKKVIIGSETMDLETVGFGAASSTYFEEGVDFMMKEQQKIQEHYTNADKKAFGGIAFHYLKDFRQLPMDFRRTVKDAGDRPFTVSLKKTAAKKIDGVLTDWPAKPTFKIYRKADIVHPQKDPDWKDKNDLSCQAWVGWSKAGLYFAFKVQDNVILQKWQKNHLWQGDYVELQLDTELSRDYNDTGMSGDDFQFGFSPGNFKNLKAETFCFVPGLGKQEQKKIRQISKRTQTGYIIEVFIPKTVLKNINLTEGAAIGLNINPSDTDDVGHVQKIMMSTSRIRHRSNPTTFGKAVLVK